MDIRRSRPKAPNQTTNIGQDISLSADNKSITRDESPTRQGMSLRKILAIIFVAVIGFILILLIIRLAYTGRIYQGVWGNGVYLGGLTKKQAVELLNKQTNAYLSGHEIKLQAGNSKWVVKTADIDVRYDNAELVEELYLLGRSGSIYRRFTEELQLFIGLTPKDNYKISFDPVKLDHYSINIAENTNSPVRNASYKFDQGNIMIEPEKAGSRLDLSNLNQALIDHLGGQKDSVVILTPKEIAPLVNQTTLENGKQQINTYASSDVSLSYGENNWQIHRQQILDWIRVVAISSDVFKSDQMMNYYPRSGASISYEPDKKMIADYLTTTSKAINRPAQDAKLTIVDGRATVFVRSVDGRELNISSSTELIAKAITGQAERHVPLNVDVKKAAVSDDNIEALGIRELLSEGVTIFPGSSADRNTNIRIGASRYNGVLLKPGQQFSFEDYLGPIGPEQGYKQSKVILEGRLENEYGGGLCQVSSTAFRAALLAGLPITERYNHAFAVSYYTAPYNVPGVDATIYYPGVDFKFRNDTDAHILIQTEMVGTTLKFRFYGTKKKEGVIRGPNFVSGSSDANQPSRTVFYRDVVVDGKVTKTNTFYTNYKSAKDFPPVN